MADVVLPRGDKTGTKSPRGAEAVLLGCESTAPYGAEGTRGTGILSSQDDSLLDVRKNSFQLMDYGYVGTGFFDAARRSDRLFEGRTHIELLHTRVQLDRICEKERPQNLGRETRGHSKRPNSFSDPISRPLPAHVFTLATN